LVIALATLGVTLVVGIPAAYALHLRSDRFSRAIEEIITLPLAIPGLALALALLLTYGGFSDFRRSWLFILAGHAVFTLPFMVRSVLAVFGAIDVKTRGITRRFAMATIPGRHRAQCGAWRSRGIVDGGDALARRIQSDLDAAHAVDQDLTCRTC